MSSIGFGDGVEYVLLSGRERAYMGRYCSKLAISVLDQFLTPRFVSGQDPNPPGLLELVPEHSYLHSMWGDYVKALTTEHYRGEPIRTAPSDARLRLSSGLEAWLYVGWSDGLLVPVEGYDEPQLLGVSEMALNTALVHGGDEVRLMARLDGQCEIHCWVAGENRTWLADLIDSGLSKNILRRMHPSERTWEGVSEFLRRRDDQPVVCDYSVSDDFPCYGFVSSYIGDGPHSERERDAMYHDWYDLDADERWRQGLEALAAREKVVAEQYETWTFELKPEGFGDVRFSWGLSAFDVAALLSERQQPIRLQ